MNYVYWSTSCAVGHSTEEEEGEDENCRFADIHIYLCWAIVVTLGYS